MGKHAGRKDGEQQTQTGGAFSQLTPEQKGAEFDASHADPRGYAMRNFTNAKPGEGGRVGGGAKHKK